MRKFRRLPSKQKKYIGFFLITFVFLTIAFISAMEKQHFYRRASGSQIIVTGFSTVTPWKLKAQDFTCEASLQIKDNALQEISGLSFSLPIKQLESRDPHVKLLMNDVFQLNEVEAISFKQSRQMVLPIMQKVHMIGYLTMGKTSQRIDLQMDYVMHEDKTISFKGVKTIKLSDFNIHIPEDTTLGVIKAKDEVKIEILINLNENTQGIEKILAM